MRTRFEREKEDGRGERGGACGETRFWRGGRGRAGYCRGESRGPDLGIRPDPDPEHHWLAGGRCWNGKARARSHASQGLAWACPPLTSLCCAPVAAGVPRLDLRADSAGHTRPQLKPRTTKCLALGMQCPSPSGQLDKDVCGATLSREWTGLATVVRNYVASLPFPEHRSGLGLLGGRSVGRS